MVTVLSVLVVMSLLGTVGVMFAGMAGIGRGGAESGARSNRLMRWRVGMQALTIALFLLLLLVKG
jgi:hypothetical protein